MQGLIGKAKNNFFTIILFLNATLYSSAIDRSQTWSLSQTFCRKPCVKSLSLNSVDAFHLSSLRHGDTKGLVDAVDAVDAFLAFKNGYDVKLRFF